MTSVFSVDVEDWFHILEVPSAPPVSAWDSLPSHVERNFRKLLDIFAEADVRTTCFFLGWVGEKFPQLVRDAAAAGHEIASHGYAHQIVHRLTPAEFSRDVSRSRKILEDLCGQPVVGYRAPGFSLSSQTAWFFPKLAEAGYIYDSSVFSAYHGHGDMIPSQGHPYVIETDCGNMTEFPLSTIRVLGRQIYCFGGGYLRLTPAFFISHAARRVVRQGSPVICYVHPREIDPVHPRLPMGLLRHFKCYINLRSTEKKIRRLSAELTFTPFRTLLSEDRPWSPQPGNRAVPVGDSEIGNDKSRDLQRAATLG